MTTQSLKRPIHLSSSSRPSFAQYAVILVVTTIVLFLLLRAHAHANTHYIPLSANEGFTYKTTTVFNDTITLTSTPTDKGCRYQGEINGVEIPGFNDENPCSNERFWAWWVVSAVKEVDKTVGYIRRQYIEFLLRQTIP